MFVNGSRTWQITCDGYDWIYDIEMLKCIGKLSCHDTSIIVNHVTSIFSLTIVTFLKCWNITELHCPILVALSHAHVPDVITSIGQTLEVTCETGYLTEDNTQVHPMLCEDSQYWNTSLPTCTREYQTDRGNVTEIFTVKRVLILIVLYFF